MKGIRVANRCLLQPPRNPRLLRQQYRHQHTHAFASLCGAEISSRRELQQRCTASMQRVSGQQKRGVADRREASNAATSSIEHLEGDTLPPPPSYSLDTSAGEMLPLNSPSPAQAAQSAKLSALHARLSLPSKLPLQTLGRCLIDPSVDARPGYSNAPLAMLGQDLLAYYTAEHLICHFPRLPMPILFAAQFAYNGPPTLNAMRAEWGVETVAAPGREVDAGLLQLTRVIPGNSIIDPAINVRLRHLRDQSTAARRHAKGTASASIVFDDEFGEARPEAKPYPGAPLATANSSETQLASDISPSDLSHPAPGSLTAESEYLITTDPATVEQASAGFIRALFGSLYLHAGAEAAKLFHRDHILSRYLELHKLFDFTYPTRDLSRLCAREDFEPPVARLISETGRLSRTPVFVVGVFSGEDKLGEGAGASLNEARVRASAAALRSWYLYSPPVDAVMVPSDVEGSQKMQKEWKPQMIDIGEVVT